MPPSSTSKVAPPARKSSPSKAWFARIANTLHGYQPTGACQRAPNQRDESDLRLRRTPDQSLDFRLDSVLGTFKPAVKAVRSARPKSHRPMPLDELMWPSCPTPILGTPQSAASCSAAFGAQYGSLSLNTISPGS